MPGTACTQAPVACPRTARGQARAEPILDLAMEMHLPMNEARDLVQAIELAELGSDYGAAVPTLARAAAERLTTFHDVVMDLIQLAYRFEEATGVQR
jgi:hypothetical protein